MVSMLNKLLDSLIREEEALNHRYHELAGKVDNPVVADQLRQFGTQGYDRIQQLYALWKSVRETKP